MVAYASNPGPTNRNRFKLNRLFKAKNYFRGTVVYNMKA